jgi:hypothetical protein
MGDGRTVTAAARSQRVSVRVTAVPSTGAPGIDRRHSQWMPLYLETLRRVPDKDGRPGMGLDPGPAFLYHFLIFHQGTPQLGRRVGADDEKPITRRWSAGKIVQAFGLTYDQVQSWSDALARPVPCPACRRAHPLLRIHHGRGRPKTFSLLNCTDIAEGEAVPIAAVVRQRRTKTGGRATGREGQPTLLSVTDEVSEKVRHFSQGGGQEPPSSVEEARLVALVGIAALEGVTAPPDVVAAIARTLDTTDVVVLRSALLHVVASAGIRRERLTPAFVNVALRELAEREVSEKLRRFRGDETDETTLWALERILDLAHRAEPGTTPVQARGYLKELTAAIDGRFGGDPVAQERELHRILTDPRVCGTFGKPTDKPIAILRDGLKHGWIWKDADRDDGGSRLGRAFRRDLAPGEQAEVLRIFERYHAGEPLPRRKLEQYKIMSEMMIQYLTDLTRPPAPRT